MHLCYPNYKRQLSHSAGETDKNILWFKPCCRLGHVTQPLLAVFNIRKFAYSQNVLQQNLSVEVAEPNPGNILS